MVTTLQVASSDATVYGTSPDRVWSNISYLTVGSGASGRQAFVYFNRPFPLGVTIASATLRLTQQRAADVSASRTLTAAPVVASWLESKITWNNAPGVGTPTASSAAQTGTGTAGRVIEIDVTAIMQAVANGAAWYGLRVVSNDANILPLFSREAGQGAPTLEVTWSDAPQTPTRLVPSAGRAVSVARPVLSWDATELAAYQVQLNGSDSWGSPATDTGEVAADLPQYALTSDIAIDAVLWWRVRYKNTAGLWSEWSDGASFTRKALPTVTITNPATSPNNVVTEPTPPFAWTAAGQVAYRLLVTDAVDPTQVFFDSGKVTSTSTTATPSNDLTLATGRDYRLEVRVFDNVAREATPGVPIYAVAERVFTFALSESTDPVFDLSGSQVDERPWWSMSFKDNTAADQYLFLRDGQPVALLDAADVFVDGITYEWVDREASPRTSHQWEVRRVVNGETSQDNPVSSGTITALGAWVSTLDGSHIVMLAGEGPVRWDADELVELYRPYGGSAVHIVTGAVFGRSGSASGALRAYDGRSFADEAAELAALRDRDAYPYGTPLILTLSDTSTRIFWYDVVQDERDEFSDDIGLRFRFCELPRVSV